MKTPTTADWQYVKERYVLMLIKKKGKEEALRLYPECKVFILKQTK